MNGSPSAMLCCLALATALLFLDPCSLSQAQAAVIKITQARVLAGGITPGDAPGFPATIGEPGSYQLKSDLSVPDEDTSAIQILADDVTIDLNGFTISGPTVCSGEPLTCAPTGMGYGIVGIGAQVTQANTTVVNGTIRGMGRRGVYLGGEAHVQGVRAISNGLAGIYVLGGAIVTDNTATQNGSQGIAASFGSTVAGNTTDDNGGRGIQAGAGVTLSGNTATRNGSDGIMASDGSSLSHNQASSNAGFGLRLEQATGYHNNVLTGNNGGDANPQVSLGTNLSHNVCGTDTICP